jgi:hypothetical protein
VLFFSENGYKTNERRFKEMRRHLFYGGLDLRQAIVKIEDNESLRRRIMEKDKSHEKTNNLKKDLDYI